VVGKVMVGSYRGEQLGELVCAIAEQKPGGSRRYLDAEESHRDKVISGETIGVCGSRAGAVPLVK